MPSVYLQAADYATYGLDPANTTQAQVIQASATIDGYLMRQFGMLYESDGNGNPCYMTAKNPRVTLHSIGSITAGENVEVSVTGPYQSILVGDTLILDRAQSDIVEACVIRNKTNNALTLERVLFNHNAAVTMDAGLVIVEERNTPSDRNIIHTLQAPLVRLISGQGQYGYSRRGDTIDYTNIVYNAAIVFAYVGGPPLYEFFNVESPWTLIESDNGIIYYPTGIYTLHYSKVKIGYVAGWTYDNLPYQIKQAAANLVNAQASSGGISGPVKSFKQGDTQVVRFGGNSKGTISFSLMDEDTKNMLRQFRARPFL